MGSTLETSALVIQHLDRVSYGDALELQQDTQQSAQEQRLSNHEQQ